MAYKTFMLAGEQPVKIYKRRNSRNLRLSITAAGEIRVSIPWWASYRAGIEFAKSRQKWIAEQHRPKPKLADGQPVGKAHHLKMVAESDRAKVSTRVNGTEIIVAYPDTISVESPEVQQAANKACIRALRQEAERLLPQRLSALSEQHGIEYKSVSVRLLKGRWGSCDQRKHIVLNLYLMQLSWELIDYVMVHELAHTRVLRHGPDFWAFMEELQPDSKARRKALRAYQPIVNGEL
jgi:predicted metal-dependent hydrolase